jgi:uncharacterized membrane protein
MSNWTFYFTALPLGVAVVIIAFAVMRAITHDQADIFAVTCTVAMGVGYTLGRLENNK